MATKTNNYNLIKPSLSDPADITAINSNWDTIDAELKSNVDKVDNVNTILSAKINKLQTKVTYGTGTPSGGSSGDVYIQLLD